MTNSMALTSLGRCWLYMVGPTVDLLPVEGGLSVQAQGLEVLLGGQGGQPQPL